MEKFTVEEINLMCIFDTTSRAALLAEMRESLPHVYEPELVEIMQTVTGKLDRLTDEEFAEIGFYAADNFEEMEV